MKRGILVAISGFSGAGKGTLMNELTRRFEDKYALSISATTREPRPGESEGVEYYFKKPAEFDKMIADNELIEYAKYVDNYYGTPKSYVEKELEGGRNVILEIEIQGALKVKKKYPEALLIFITPPSAEELFRRLVNRGTESIEDVNSRMRRAIEEAEGIENYDYLLVNDDLEECVDELHQIIQMENNSTRRNHDFIEKIQGELKEYWKGE